MECNVLSLKLKKKHEFTYIPQMSKTAIQRTKHEKLEKV